MTPIQQAIKELEKYTGMDYAITILQSLLPFEKEWAGEVFDAGWKNCYQDMYEGTEHPDFEQYYSQFNEVK